MLFTEAEVLAVATEAMEYAASEMRKALDAVCEELCPVCSAVAAGILLKEIERMQNSGE